MTRFALLRSRFPRPVLVLPPIVDRGAARGLAWFAERSPRERMLIAGMALLFALVLVVTLVIRPLQAARADALAQIGIHDALNARLRAIDPAAGAARRRLTGTASAIITTSAAEFGLTISRVEPEAGRTRVVLEDARFDSLVQWLDRIERDSAVRIGEIRLERRPAPGIVGAQITLVG